MLRRLIEWIVGRKEPELHEVEKEKRLRNLELQARVIARRGK